jgi:hypothetical protein
MLQYFSSIFVSKWTCLVVSASSVLPMAMNYNDVDAPQFVDFAIEDFDNGEGDSWFSNNTLEGDGSVVSFDESVTVEEVS